ncbi:mitochondrial ubiquitin ligase activator of nfkb 1-A [Parambassis ranga]|uniref:RING-type E3 ubiquitin transferase n=1 Tax=Parambassis ranga TaxID=210632 RepID=A0A6P7K2M6_9TELE|nr:mitochondrial ubiquitin ligase activator of nfkb 1-A-like [Parambassis ranga]XP_028283550.1 mitochondrial ubiquitin ligase activator of nfkb 1-A-like [Parambassis ranga]
MDRFSLSFTEALCLGTSLAISGLCYYLYRKNKKTVDKLDNAPHFNIDGKLKDILEVTPGACLQYAVVEGVVKPAGEPLRSQFHKDIVGVLHKLEVREHRLVWRGYSNIWSDDERVLHKQVSMVPFLLRGLDETAVRVHCPLQASGLNMEMTYEKFHQVSHGFVDLVGQYLSGVKPKGQLEIEEMLKVGTTVTGVGELMLDTDGTLNLRPPSDGAQYILSMADYDTLRNECKAATTVWKDMTIIFALAGAAALCWVGLRYYQHQKLRWERDKERREFERQRSEARRFPVQDGENNQENICVICLSQPRNCILLNCGHVCCCYTCYQALPQRRCPICRQGIVRVQPLFLV